MHIEHVEMVLPAVYFARICIFQFFSLDEGTLGYYKQCWSVYPCV